MYTDYLSRDARKPRPLASLIGRPRPGNIYVGAAACVGRGINRRPAAIRRLVGAGIYSYKAALGDGEDLPTNRDRACARTAVVSLHGKAHRPVADACGPAGDGDPTGADGRIPKAARLGRDTERSTPAPDIERLTAWTEGKCATGRVRRLGDGESLPAHSDRADALRAAVGGYRVVDGGRAGAARRRGDGEPSGVAGGGPGAAPPRRQSECAAAGLFTDRHAGYIKRVTATGRIRILGDGERLAVDGDRPDALRAAIRRYRIVCCPGAYAACRRGDGDPTGVADGGPIASGRGGNAEGPGSAALRRTCAVRVESGNTRFFLTRYQPAPGIDIFSEF